MMDDNEARDYFANARGPGKAVLHNWQQADRDNIIMEALLKLSTMERDMADIDNISAYQLKTIANVSHDYFKHPTKSGGRGGIKGKKELKCVPIGDDDTPIAKPGEPQWPPLMSKETSDDMHNFIFKYSDIKSAVLDVGETIERKKNVPLTLRGVVLFCRFVLHKPRKNGKHIHLSEVLKHCRTGYPSSQRSARDALQKLKPFHSVKGRRVYTWPYEFVEHYLKPALRLLVSSQ